MPGCGIAGCTIVGGAGGGVGPPIAKNISAAEAGAIATGAARNNAVATPRANVVNRVIVVSHFWIAALSLSIGRFCGPPD
jgi:hypothetical protein